MIVNVCTAVFSRYELLRELAASLEVSTRRPDMFWIVDHGYDEAKVRQAVDGAWLGAYRVITLEDPGAAHGANWCFDHIVGEKIFCGDDVTFTRRGDSERLVSTEGEFIVPRQTLNAFACCLIRDSCFSTVGRFDETLSPRYLYFEDCDYAHRMRLLNVPVTVVEDAVVGHVGSATYKSYTDEQMAAHHKKFLLAKQNYIAKWGGTPHEEKFTVPYDGRQP
jgi:hypothetical protein